MSVLKWKCLKCFLAAMISVAAVQKVNAGSIKIETEGERVIAFDVRGMTYAEIHTLVAAFAGVGDRLAASPPEKMQLTTKDTTWAELMMMLYDSDSFQVARNDEGKLVVTRVPRK